jgi:hypothetical protein
MVTASLPKPLNLAEYLYQRTGLVVIDDSVQPDPNEDIGYLVLEGRLVKKLLDNNRPAKSDFKAKIEKLYSPESIREQYGNVQSAYFHIAVNNAWQEYQQAVIPGAAKILQEAQLDMGKRTKTSLIKRYHLHQDATINFSGQPGPTEWTQQDATAMEFLGKNHALFMGQHFNQVQQKTIRNIVARDYSLFGDNPEKIGTRIKDGLSSMADTTDSYYKVVATNALTHARTYSSLRWMSENAIVAYAIKAVLDSHTTYICRSLNGKTFPVQAALDLYGHIQQATSLEELDRISPMVRAQTENGKPTGKYTIGKGV